MENKINSLTSEYESQITEFYSTKGKLRGEIEAEKTDKNKLPNIYKKPKQEICNKERCSKILA